MKRFSPQKISTHHLIYFFHQLSLLLKSNIPLLQSCQLLLQSQTERTMQRILLTIQHDIETGHSLTQGLLKFPNYFNAFIIHLTQIGEQSGTLETTLELIALSLQKSQQTKDKLRQATFYPLIVLLFSFGICLFMLIFIVPRFAEFFHSMPGPMPFFTQSIITLSTFLRSYYWLGFIPVISFILIRYYYQYTPHFRQQCYDLLTSLPFFSQILTKFFAFNFARNMAILYNSGINITSAIEILINMTRASHFQQPLKQMRLKVLSGHHLHVAMRSCSLFPPIMISMIKISEESGTLGDMLNTISSRYETELDQLIERLHQSLEPLIMIILGVLIGGLIIAMYLPIFKLGMMI